VSLVSPFLLYGFYFDNYHSKNCQIYIKFFFQFAGPDASGDKAWSYRIVAVFWCSGRFSVATMESFESATLTFCSR